VVKRLLDIVIASFVLVITSPILLVAAVAIAVASPGPVFYRAERIGKDGIPFTMWKFRTMRVSDDPGAAITKGGDPRITPVGRVLRKMKLDELPQLMNVVKGDMSLVGPRPEAPKYVMNYTSEQRRVLSVRPGVTGPAAIAYRHEEAILAAADDLEKTYVEVVLPEKLQMDLQYVERHTLGGDLAIMARTLRALFVRSESQR
jgi:lipopolysaccharide/colanic/teichoic acid biosynthesis glycosyltransferase